MTAKTKKPAKTVSPSHVMPHHMRGWRKSEVRAALEAAGVTDIKQRRFISLWKVARPRAIPDDYAEFDAEARGIIAHAICLTPYDQVQTIREYRYLYTRAGKYIQRCIEGGCDVSVSVVKIWKELRWCLPERNKGHLSHA